MADGLLRPSPFLNNKSRWLLESDLCFVYDNEFPVTKKHALIIPKREIETFDQITADEWSDVQSLIVQYTRSIDCLGFNIGFNGGKIAGQSVAHLHIHIFPHFDKDAPMPRGGCCLAFDNLPDYYK